MRISSSLSRKVRSNLVRPMVEARKAGSSSSSSTSSNDGSSSKISAFPNPRTQEEPRTSAVATASEGIVTDQAGAAGRKKKKKLKTEKSVVRDKDKGCWSCRYCGWVYPNPRPNAKQRRDHRKHCANFQGVREWFGRFSGEGVDEEEASSGKLVMDTNHPTHDDGLSWFSQHEGSDSGEKVDANASEQQKAPALSDLDSVDASASENGLATGDEQQPALALSEAAENGSASVENDPEQQATLALSEAAENCSESVENDPEQQPTVALSEAAENGSASVGNEPEQPENVSASVKDGPANEPGEKAADVYGGEGEQGNSRFVPGSENGNSSENTEKSNEIFNNESEDQTADKSQGLKKRIEYVELKGKGKSSSLGTNNSWVAISEAGTRSVDLAEILKEQTTHDLLCPNCGSCITRRVILRKRKRTSGSDSGEIEHERPKRAVEVDEPLEISTGGVREESSQPKESITEREASVDDGETEDWGCLACFSVFCRRVRGVRFPRLALTEEEPDRKSSSCLSFLAPDFAWDGKGRGSAGPVTQEIAPDRTGSTCLPLKLPWKKDTEETEKRSEEEIREVEIFIDLRSRPPRQEAPENEHSWMSRCLPFPSLSKEQIGGQLPAPSETVATSEEASTVRETTEEETSHFDCVPLLLPTYWNEGEQRAEQVQMGEKEPFNKCLPIVLPSYSIDPGVQVTQTPETDVASTSATTSGQERKASLNCFTWGAEDGSCLPILFAKSSASQDAKVEQVQDVLSAQAEQVPEEKGEAGLSSLPVIIPASNDTTKVDSPDNDKEKEEGRSSLNCIPAWLPLYASDSQAKKKDLSGEVKIVPSPVQETEDQPAAAERKEDKKCIPITLPKYSWRIPKIQPETSSEEGALAAQEQRYITRETRIQAWINTITSVVIVRPWRRNQVEKVQVGSKSDYVDVKLSDQPEALGGKKTDILTTAPSTGWALVDELDKGQNEEETPLVDKRKRPSTLAKISEAKEESQSSTSEVPEIIPVPRDEIQEDLTRPLLSTSEKEIGVEGFLTAFATKTDENKLVPRIPVTSTVSVKAPGTLVQVKGDDTKEALDTALLVAGEVGVLPPQEKGLEIVKSIVYGGVEICIASLAVVSSAAGADTKTINLLATALANVFAGFIVIFHNIGSLYLNDRAAFEERVGRNFWLNGAIALVSFLIFGFVAPLTYALSFRSLDDRDYKFATSALASLVCIVLLGFGKARVQKRGYISTAVNLVLTSFVAAVAGYFVGDFLKRWLQKIGFEDGNAAAPPQAAAAPPSLVPLIGRKTGMRLTLV